MNFVKLSGETAGKFITLALLAYIYDGDEKGIKLAREMRSASGDSPPIDEMITMILLDEGRLLTA